MTLIKWVVVALSVAISPILLKSQTLTISNKNSLSIDEAKEYIKPDKALYASYDLQKIRTLLSQAPQEIEMDKSRGLQFEMTDPNGDVKIFDVYEIKMMEDGLYNKFPNIRTYKAINRLNPYEYGNIDVTEQGFHAMIFSDKGTWYIDPASLNNHHAVVIYYRHDFRNNKQFSCSTEGSHGEEENEIEHRNRRTCGTTLSLSTYRAAFACTGEYTSFNGGTVALAQSAIVTSVNRVNLLYERDLAVRMVLISNNNLLIYTNANTDPYTNDDGGAMLSQNISNLSTVIGNANFDIGHVLSTGGGGVAYLGVICNNSWKAGGVTGSSAPIADPFDIDYIAHEVGHQFGGNHTFNSVTGSCCCGNRNMSTAYEPGSGSTIMAYAGICGAHNLQANSDDYFHVQSLNEILNHIEMGSGNSCRVNTAITNTTPTVPTITSGLTIPANTHFILDAAAIDANGDAITYCWEQYNLGQEGGPGANASTSPLFRSFNPTGSSSRSFLAMNSILTNTTPFGEVLPSVARTLNFRLTARDNHPSAGGVCIASSTVTVVASTGFAITSPNTSVSWPNNSNQNITWSVGGTNVAPVNCPNVYVDVSFDNGYTFTTIGENVPNNGSFTWAIPATVNSTDVRFRVRAANNIFFDINNQPITIGTPSAESDICMTFTANDVPLDIISGATTSSYIEVSGLPAGSISDIDVIGMNGTHTDVGDLIFWLWNPQGSRTTLMSRRCSGTTSNNDNFNLSFSDGSSTNIPCPPTNGNTYGPRSPLSDLFSNSPNGLWRLDVADFGPEDEGSLVNWGLRVCVEPLYVLPVTVVSFNAQLNNKVVYLDWQVKDEVAIRLYQVERSRDGKHFERIGTVPAKGDGKYQLTDSSPANGINYYRLTTINMEDQISYHRIQTVTIGQDVPTLTVYPNPTKSKIYIQTDGSIAQYTTMTILDIFGNKVITATHDMKNLINEGVDVSDLIPGSYLLMLSNESQSSVARFTVQ